MSWYEFLLFFHIAMAVIWVGGAAMIQFFALRAIMKATGPGADGRVLPATSSGSATASSFRRRCSHVVSGLWLVIDSDFWGFGDDWIVIGLILFAITFLAGALFFGPEAGRIQKLDRGRGADGHPPYRRACSG